MDPVRCADCGYLAARDRFTRELKEVEFGMREGWALPNEAQARHPQYDLTPVCFAREIDFLKSVGKDQPQAKVVELIQIERVCPSFTEWLHGRSPREHQEMKLAEQQRKRDLDWQEEQRRGDARREEERTKADREWRESQDAKTRWWQFKLALIAASLAVLSGSIVAVITYLITRAKPASGTG